MSVARTYLPGFVELELSCDECGDLRGRTFLPEEFGAMIRDARQAMWSVKQDRLGYWKHTCPTCLLPGKVKFRRTYEPDIEDLL